MAIVRELVTLLRYQVENSGLKEYAQKATFVGKQVSGVGRAAMEGWRQGVRQALGEYGLVPGRVLAGIREQRRLNAEQRRSVQNVKEIGGGYNALAGRIRSLFGTYLGYQGLKGFVLGGDEFGQIEARLKNATTSMEEFRKVDSALAANSRESYKPFAANAELFIRTNDTLKALGKTTQDTLDVVSATNLSLAASGADAQKAASFVDQFGRALGLGKLNGQAFQNMIANNQRMLKYLVDGLNETNPALGATMANFQKLVTEGKITTDVMIPALRSQIAKMRKDVEGMPVSLGDAATVFRDRLARVAWGIEKQVGLIRKMTKGLELLADNLKEILRLLWLVGASWAFLRLQGRIAAMVTGLRSAGGAAAVFGRVLRTALWPVLRMMAIFEAIRLIVGDIVGWFKGHDSVLGDIIGGSERWRKQIDWVKDALERVKELLGGAGESTAEFAKKWGTLALVVGGIIMLIGWIPTAVAAVALATIRYWDDIKQAGEDLWKSFTDGAKQSWADVKNSFQRLLDWFIEKKDSFLGFFDGMVPDFMKGTPSAATVQRSGSASVSTQDNRKTEINIHGVPANPAAVGRAAEQGVRKGYGPEVPVVPPGSLAPNVEAMP